MTIATRTTSSSSSFSFCKASTSFAVSAVAAGHFHGYTHTGPSSAPTSSSRDDTSPSASLVILPSLCPVVGLSRRNGAARAFFTGGLLQRTRPARALVPITPARTARRGGRGGHAPRFSTLGRAVSASAAPELMTVPRSPHDLLDDMPVYEPNDWNGPPLSRLSTYLPMRSLPFSTAPTFFLRKRVGGDGAGALRTSGTGSSSSSSSNGSSYSFNNRASEEEARDVLVDARAARGRKEAAEDFFCRLCREELQPTTTPRVHLTTASTGSHVSHPVREVALDTLTLLAIRGYPIDDMLTVWAETLYHNPDLPRIVNLSNPRWSIEKRANRIGDLLHAFKRAGVIDVSLARRSAEDAASMSAAAELQRRRRVGYERLEYLGDSFWSLNVAKRLVHLFPDQQWIYGERSFAFNAIRDACEMNTNLDFAFDTLQIESLLVGYRNEGLGVGKMKADFVEAILGELHTYAIAFEPKLDDDVAFVEVNGAREAQLCALVQHCLTELYDLVVLQHARQLLPTAVPLAKELASKSLWRQTSPALLPFKRVFRSSGKVRGGGGSGRGYTAGVVGSAADESGGVLGSSAEDSIVLALSSLAPTDAVPDHSDPDANNPKVPDAAALMEHEVRATESHGDASCNGKSATSGAALLTGPGTLPVVTAATTSTTSSPALPMLTSVSLAVVASIQRGTTHILPGLPRLFATPRVRPTHLPHPLRHLPLSAIPRATYCEHTCADVFAEMIASYRRLGLISDNVDRIPRYVISLRPPRWKALIAALVPQLAQIAMQGNDVEDVEKMYEPESDVSGLLFPREAAVDEGVRLHGGDMQSGEVTRRLLASIDQGELYCRDGVYDLAAAPSAATPVPRRAAQSAASSPGTVAWVLGHTGLPALAAQPTDVADTAVGGGGGSGSDGTAYSDFAKSRFVPPGTRPPPAGVVTDRNLHRGVFPFLAVGVSDPLGWAASARAAQRQIELHGADVVKPGETAKVGLPAEASAHEVERSFAEEVEDAFEYWKTQRRHLSFDRQVFLADRLTMTSQPL